MNDEDWRAAWDAFEVAENMPEAQAEAFLDGSTVSPEVRHAVARMLQVGASVLTPDLRTTFSERGHLDEAIRQELESLLAAGSDSCDGDMDIGTVGPYEIQEKLGEGGMGVVYRARQTSPVIRDVALKIIRPGLASRQLVARFQMERQALAIMDHPSIARVLDAGSTSGGLPYMAMEILAGRSITRFCQAENLGVRDRVELMIPVCQALQHAHQKGIIHRDIKPSNVLVVVYDGKAVPKVIDFGIAKGIETIEAALGTMDGATRPGMMVGTFDYASPEQADPGVADVDTRTDIYSLGALLYHVLTGRAPLEGLSLNQSSYSEILRRIREEMPPPVSSRVKDLRAPELDWIVAKAMEKDRERRYASADGLAKDLRRYLDGEPVEAGPPAVWYHVRKFGTRHWRALGLAAAGLAMLMTALVWMSIALRQQQRANTSSQALRDVVRKIIVERPAQLARMPNRTALRGELMRDAEGALEVLSRDATLTDAASQLELAKAYLAIGKAKGPYSSQGSEGDPAGAARYVRKSADLYLRLAAARPDDVEIRRGEMDALSTWLALQYRLNNGAEGERTARQIETEIGRMSPALKEKIQANWYLSIALVERGTIQFHNGYEDAGLVLHRKAAEIIAGAPPLGLADDPEKLDHWASVQRELAISAWMFAGLSEEALTAARRGVAVLERCDTPACRMRRAQVQGTLGEMEWSAGRIELGIATMRESVATLEALAAEDPANAVYVHSGAIVRNYLALALAKRGDGADAVALAEKSLRSQPGPDGALFKGRERILVHQITLGAALLGAKRFAAAERELRNTLEGNRDWEPNSDLLWSTLHLLTKSLAAQGRFEEALRVAAEERKLVEPDTNRAFSAAVLKAIAAWDYAWAVAHCKGSPASQVDEASRVLAKATARLETPYAVITGALLEAPPAADPVATLQGLLRRTPGSDQR